MWSPPRGDAHRDLLALLVWPSPGANPRPTTWERDTLTTKPPRCGPRHEAMLTETCWLSWYDLARGRTRDLPHECGTLSHPDVVPATRRCSPRLAGSPGMTWPWGEPATYHMRAGHANNLATPMWSLPQDDAHRDLLALLVWPGPGANLQPTTWERDTLTT